MGIGEIAEPKAKLKKKVEIMDESLIEKQNGNFANTLLAAGWIPIDKQMPPPVTPVLVFGWCCDICHNIRIAEWEDGVGWWQSFSGGEDLTFKPEYWMSLPFPSACS